LRLHEPKGLQQRAGQRRVLSATVKVYDTLFLVGDVLGTARNVMLGFRQMLKLQTAIHAHRAVEDAGGSAIGLSATDAYGQSRCR
jgi:hypothetical protein